MTACAMRLSRSVSRAARFITQNYWRSWSLSYSSCITHWVSMRCVWMRPLPSWMRTEFRSTSRFQKALPPRFAVLILSGIRPSVMQSCSSNLTWKRPTVAGFHPINIPAFDSPVISKISSLITSIQIPNRSLLHRIKAISILQST